MHQSPLEQPMAWPQHRQAAEARDGDSTLLCGCRVDATCFCTVTLHVMILLYWDPWFLPLWHTDCLWKAYRVTQWWAELLPCYIKDLSSSRSELKSGSGGKADMGLKVVIDSISEDKQVCHSHWDFTKIISLLFGGEQLKGDHCANISITITTKTSLCKAISKPNRTRSVTQVSRPQGQKLLIICSGYSLDQ